MSETLDLVVGSDGEFYGILGHVTPKQFLRRLIKELDEWMDWAEELLWPYGESTLWGNLRVFYGEVIQGWMKPGTEEDYPEGCEWGDPAETRWRCQEGDLDAEAWTYWEA